MINLTPKFDKKFIMKYKDDIIKNNNNQKIMALSQTIPPNEKIIFDDLFSAQNLIKISLLPPNFLNWFLEKIICDLPIIIERYNPCLLIRDYDMSLFHRVPVTLRGKTNKQTLHRLAGDMIFEFNNIRKESNRIIVDEIIDMLLSSQDNSHLKRKIESIKEFIGGDNSILNHEYKNKFPSWINALYDAFDFDTVSKKYGDILSSAYALGYCPYCNDEPIHKIKSKNKTSRPALDHFLPRGRYPFFAINIYNLVPSGHRCNSSFKLMKDTYTAMNPNLKSDKIPHGQIFRPTFLPGKKITEENLSIELIHNNNKFMRSESIFALKAVYNSEEIKKETVWVMERINYLKSMNQINDVLEDRRKIYSHLKIDLSKKASSVRWKKLLVDLLNQETNSNFNACI